MRTFDTHAIHIDQRSYFKQSNDAQLVFKGIIGSSFVKSREKMTM